MPTEPGSDGAIPVTEYIAHFEPGIRKLLREAHKLVRDVAPDAVERAYRGWRIRIKTDRGHVMIAGLRDRVDVHLGKGAALQDPHGVLQGTGASTRHVRIRSVEDARSDALRDLVTRELRRGPRRLRISDAARDRIVKRLRAMCLGLPDASERPSHGSPTFFYRDKKAFLQILDDFHEDGRFAIWCAAPSGAQSALVKADPDRFFVPPYVGTRGWLGMRLDRRMDWDELERIIEDAYGEVATRPPG